MTTKEKKNDKVLDINQKVACLSKELTTLNNEFNKLSELENSSISKMSSIFENLQIALKNAEIETQNYSNEKRVFEELASKRNANLERQKEILAELESLKKEEEKIAILIKADGVIEADEELDVDFSKTPERIIKFIFGAAESNNSISTKGMLYLEWYMDNYEKTEAVFENEQIGNFCSKLIAQGTKE